MRIVAGSAGGIPLIPPPTPVRPTMDRVREAVFSSLGDAVPGARVLDLFAGAGSLGMEALSRGAVSAVFVEHTKACADVIRHNLAKTRLSGSVQTMDAFRYLDLYGGEEAHDLIFADPPYCKREGDPDYALLLLDNLALHRSLAPNGLLVLETDSRWKTPATAQWTLLREKRYGGTGVRIYCKAE